MSSREGQSGVDLWARRIAMASIFGCLMVVVTTGLTAAGLLPGRAVPMPPPSGYAVGSRLDVPADWYNSARRTVLLFVRTDCAASTRAVGFLVQVREHLRAADVSVRLVVPGDDRDAEMRFARDAGFEDVHVEVARFTDLSLAAVPAIVVGDDEGTVLWQGIASADPDRGTGLIAELTRVTED
jgi:hypothetical protein